jgi:hypothetical protein
VDGPEILWDREVNSPNQLKKIMRQARDCELNVLSYK